MWGVLMAGAAGQSLALPLLRQAGFLWEPALLNAGDISRGACSE